MVFTQHFCAAYGNEYIRRNGSAGGHAKCQCKDCGDQARFTPAAVAKTVQYVQIDELLSERNSQRGIARVTDISRVTIASRIKTSTGGRVSAAPLTPQKEVVKGVESAGTG